AALGLATAIAVHEAASITSLLRCGCGRNRFNCGPPFQMALASLRGDRPIGSHSLPTSGCQSAIVQLAMFWPATLIAVLRTRAAMVPTGLKPGHRTIRTTV